MVVSSMFNRLYHALLNEAKRLDIIKVDLDVKGIFPFRPKLISNNSFKQLMKALNLDYPRKNDELMSTTEISNKELVLHTEWLINVVYENGGKIKMIKEELSRLIKDMR